MTVLSWDKPKRKKSVDEWKNDRVFDGGPPGGFIPNMSEEDQLKWKATIVGKTTATPAVEIRKVAGSQIKIVVRANDLDMSMNGKSTMTVEDFQNLHDAVKEARAVLAEMKNTK